MSFDFQQYAFDTAKSTEGVSIKHPESGVYFKIARSTNRPYKAAIAAFFKANKKRLEEESLEAAEFAEAAILKIKARHILTGWEGEVQIGKEKLAYSQANSERLLALEAFGAWVTAQSETTDHYSLISEEEEKK